MDMCVNTQAHNASAPAPASVDPAVLRQALGHFVTGVTIVGTVSHAGAPVACTVNSFTSVSLDPPLVLFSLARHKNSVVHFTPGQPFGVSVLAQGQRGISDRFARSQDHKWDGVSHRSGVTGAPLIDDAAVAFEGIVEANHDGGDHVIVIGRVHRVQRAVDEVRPLVFHRGRYASLFGEEGDPSS